MVPGRLLTYSDSTVAAINRTAPVAIKRPRGSPRRAPASPKQAASPTNANRMTPRLAPNNRDGDRVVNKESPNNQGNVAQEAQVPAKSCQHAAILVRTGALRANLHAGGKHGP